MGIRKFGGIDLYEPEDISQDTSQWNCNCFYCKGRLKFQNFLVQKEPKITEIYERKYFNKNIIQGSPAYEYTLYRIKGILSYEHEGDGTDEFDHGIPKPTVRVHFDYNNDSDILDHYHNILDSLFAEKVIDSDFYNAIIRNLKDCDMVSECEIAVSYSGPYGESGLTVFKIANAIPYFFLEIPLFEKLNKDKSYNTFKNIKYVNVYIRYEFMEDFLLLDRYDFEVTDKKPNQTPGNRNRYTKPRGGVGITSKKPFIEYAEMDYTDNEGETETKNILWYFSGFFKYEDDSRPSLQWFVPNKIISKLPMLITEQQTYIADSDLEDINTDSYDDLKDFWNDSSTIDSGLDYGKNDDIIKLYEYIDVTIEDNINDGDDGSITKITNSTFKNNVIYDVDSYDVNNWVYENDDNDAYWYVVKAKPQGVISYQLAVKGSSADGQMTKPEPHCRTVIFEKGLVGDKRKVSFGNDIKPSRETMTTDIVINKYHEFDNKRIIVDTMHLNTDSKFFDIELKDCVFDENDESNQYVYQVWMKDNSIDGGYMLVQEIDFSSWKDYKDASGDFYKTEHQEYISSVGFSPSYSFKTKGNNSFEVNADEQYYSVYNKDVEIEELNSNAHKGYDYARIYHRGRHLNETAYDIADIYKLYGSGATETGGGGISRDGGFSSIAEFFNDGNWKLYIGFNPGDVKKHELYTDFQDTIDLTVQTYEYNYDELLEIVKDGVAIEGPEKYSEMFQKKTVSKHELYMDRLFKSIDDDNGKSLLYFSEQSYPETFDESSVFKFNSPILHLENYREKLYIFTEKEIKILSGSNNLTFILDRFYTDGCYEWTVVQHEDVLYFSNNKGIYAIQEGYPVSISNNVIRLFDEEKIVPDYAEVLTSSSGDFYVLHLLEKITPLEMRAISFQELQMINGGGQYILNGVDWKSSYISEEDGAKLVERFSINKIAVSLRDGSIWFGTDLENAEKQEFLWKSSEMVQESFFVMKSFKRVSLDFFGRVSSVFSRNRQDPLTFVTLPLTSSATSLGEKTKNTNKRSKDDPSDWPVQGERSHSNSILFLSENVDSILYKWEIVENGYSIGDNKTENEN